MSRVSEVVSTSNGKLTGIRRNGVNGFLGLPYGEAPVGDRRFKPPVPKLPWSGILRADQHGPCCWQNNHELAAWRDTGDQSEDCLTLNVWTPAGDPEAKRPVMVWVHGGFYTTGSAGLALYDGGLLAGAEDLVVVSINHRLNLFGYLYLGGIDRSFSDSGNLGQQDLILGLRWVRNNIARFGGDSDNVTLFGESGGGAKITVLTGMPAASGLYHKVIVQSGWLLNVLTLAEATERARLVVDRAGVCDGDVARLQRLPAKVLHGLEAEISDQLGLSAFFPVADGLTLPTPVWGADRKTRGEDIPMLVGTTLEEAAYFLPAEVYREPPADDTALESAIQKACAPLSLELPEIRSLVQGYQAIASQSVTRLDLLIQIVTDMLFFGNAVLQAEHHASAGRVFMYRFDWRYPCWGGCYSVHGGEIPFIFNTLDYTDPAWDEDDSPQRRAAADPLGWRFELAERMRKAWSAFARHGDPSHAELPAWLPYTATERATMIFDAQSHVAHDPTSERRSIAMRVGPVQRQLALRQSFTWPIPSSPTH